ncbi:hypothetical protein [Microbispora sp. H10836]|uniref:hypothetical protein n=1 Tax=Microbispora sp. H10836 TaxID=2729106 RepID=UPI0014752916|nr:hypothetical protein [Microbispora sp. H10836]
MFTVNSARRVLALGATLVTTGVLSAALAPTPAAAAAVTVQATVDCGNFNSYGDTWDSFPIDPSISASPYGAGGTPSIVSVPITNALRLTQTLPSGTTSVSVSAMCSRGHVYDFFGSADSVTIPAGVTTVTAAWKCYTAPVNPGPWRTDCYLQSASYS